MLSDEDFSLPETVTTQNGAVFDPRQPRWSYRDGAVSVNIDFSSITGVTRKFLLNMKLVIIWYVENKSPAHARGMFLHMKKFLKIISRDTIVSEITDTDIMNYRAQLDANSYWYLASFAGFLKKWHSLGLPGITKDTIDFLNDIRLKGNLKGEAVLTMDPVMGPFTNIERDALCFALNNAYANDNINIADYLLCLLTALLGQRPVQYSYLKVCDIQAEQRDDGSFTCILRIPRAKQRGQRLRSVFRERALIPQIGNLLVEYSEMVKMHFIGHLKDPQQAPLFPDIRKKARYFEGLQFHQTAGSIHSRVVSIFNKLNVTSERTGELIHISPIRFRRTVGTQAAAEGHGELIIAELLDHSDTQNVGVYVAATPEIVERIDRAVAARLAPLAQAFAGVLVDGKAEQDLPHARRVVAPQSRDFAPVGSCGQRGFCGFAAPIACYTCSNFRAWLDGPHQEVLDYLIAERDRIKKTDARIAAVNDRTILAVAQVVEMCKTAQTQRDVDV